MPDALLGGTITTTQPATLLLLQHAPRLCMQHVGKPTAHERTLSFDVSCVSCAVPCIAQTHNQPAQQEEEGAQENQIIYIVASDEAHLHVGLCRFV
jgi:hypothetical protein